MTPIYNLISSVYHSVSCLFIYGCRGLAKIYKFATDFFQNSASKDRPIPTSLANHQVTLYSSENEAAFIKRMEGKPGYLVKLVGSGRKFDRQELQIKLGEAKSKIEQYNKENTENPLKIVIDGSQVHLGYSTSEFITLLYLLRITEPACPFHDLLFDLFWTSKKTILTDKDYSNAYQVKLLTEFNLEQVKKEPKIQDISSLKVDFPHFPSFNGNLDQMNAIFKSLLANHRGFFVGELHEDPVPKQILQKHMKDLYENGVRLLFLEFCCNDTLQGELDQFFEKKQPSPFLKRFLFNGYGGAISQGIHYYPMILAAVQAGIRPVGIEMSYTQGIGFQSYGGSRGKERIEVMNFTALPIIESELQKNPTAKFFGLVGSGHLSYHYDVPGLSELCGVPNLVIKGGLDPSSYSTQVLNLNVSDANLHGNITKTHFCHIQVTLNHCFRAND